MDASPLLPEIVRLVLDDVDDLGFQDTLALGHVSRTWRAAARTHPTFARDISLAATQVEYEHGTGRSVSSGAVHLFLDRLTALPEGRLNLNISLCGLEGGRGVSVDHLRAVVAQALRDCLPRLMRLTLKCNHALMPDVLAALRTGPAPQLTTFEFLSPGWESGLRDYTQDELPLDIFSGTAPLLHVLQMDAYQFPAGAVPAFSAVRVLMREVDGELWEEGAQDLYPDRFFSCCPALEELALKAHFCPLGEYRWDLCTSSQTRNLRRLTVSGSCEGDDMEIIVHALAHAAMVDIDVETMNCNGETGLFMIHHLDDSATLEVQILHEWTTRGPGDTLLVRCRVYDATRSRCRTFTHCSGDMGGGDDFYYVEWALRPSFTLNAHRFTSVTLPGTEECWHYLTAAFGDESHLANMQCLTITIPVDGLFSGVLDVDPEDPLSLPALTQIKLVADEERVEVAADDLLSLVHNTFTIPDGRTLRLELENVSLTGDTDELGSRFEIVSPPTS